MEVSNSTRVRNPSSSLKQILFQSLGASSSPSTQTNMNAISGSAANSSDTHLLPPAVEAEQLMRSRQNSLRNGETSKVIENLGIEAPKMDKDQIEEYLRFKALKNSQNQQWSTNTAPRDRKLSQEYFLEEAKRLNRKLQQGKHLATAPTPTNKTDATAVSNSIESDATLARPVAKKRFTCFKARQAHNVPSAFGLFEKMPAGF